MQKNRIDELVQDLRMVELSAQDKSELLNRVLYEIQNEPLDAMSSQFHSEG